MLVLTTLLTIGSFEVKKTEHMQRLCQVQKNIRGEPVKDVQKIGKSTLGKKDHKVVGNESIDLKNTFARLAEASSFCEDPPSPPNLCTQTSAVQNSSISVNMSEGFDEDNNEI